MAHTKKLHGADERFSDRTLCGRKCPVIFSDETDGECVPIGTVPRWEMTCSNCLRAAAHRGFDCAEPLSAEALGITAWRQKREAALTPPEPPEGPPNRILRDGGVPLEGFLLGVIVTGFLMLCFTYC